MSAMSSLFATPCETVTPTPSDVPSILIDIFGSEAPLRTAQKCKRAASIDERPKTSVASAVCTSPSNA